MARGGGKPKEGDRRTPAGAEQESILHVFVQEGREHLEALDASLLALEASPSNTELMAQALRTAHNFKGAAGTVGLNEAARLAHGLEDLLQLLRTGALPAGPELFDHFFDAITALKNAVERAAAQEPESPELCATRERLSAFGASHGGPAAAQSVETARPASAAPALGEYDRIKLEALRRRGLQIWLLAADLRDRGGTPAETATALLAGIQRHGDVVVTAPPEGQLDRLAESGLLSVIFGSNEPIEKLQATLALPGVQISHLAKLDEDTSPLPERAEPRHKPQIASAMKIDTDRVDSLVDMIGELVVIESMVVNSPDIARIASRTTRNSLSQLTRITREIQDAGMRMRMVPLRALFGAMARLVRDLARKSGKPVRLVTSGEATEMDRGMVERIADPLTHLIRNAIDHGIEPAAERARAGKAEEATLYLRARHQGGNTVIEVSDDGRGLDREAILRVATARGLLRDGTSIADSELWSFIFEPGFSTAATVTELSGRGVGLDVVRRNIEGMRGRVGVSSTLGQGSTFTLHLPITLAIIEGMLVACGAEVYIVPTLSVVESIRPKASMLATMTGRREMLSVRGDLVPMVRLADLFAVENAVTDPTRGIAVVVESLGRRVGLLVDDVVAQQQVVIKSIGDGMSSARMLSGAAILPNGNVALIVNVDEVASTGFEAGSRLCQCEPANGVGPASAAEVAQHAPGLHRGD